MLLARVLDDAIAGGFGGVRAHIEWCPNINPPGRMNLPLLSAAAAVHGHRTPPSYHGHQPFPPTPHAPLRN